MFVTAIRIARDGYISGYSRNSEADADKPFRATVEVMGTHGKVELLLSTELSRRVVEVVADEIAAAGRATAEAMTAEILTLPQIAA